MEEDGAYVAVWDIETQDKIQDKPGKFREDKIKLLNISCASVVKIPSGLCIDPEDRERAMEMAVTTTYWIDGYPAQSMGVAEGSRIDDLNAMCAVLDGAEMIVGYNLAGFDWLVTKKYFRSEEAFQKCTAKTLDVFSRIRDATGVWFKLDNLLRLNGLDTKTADGLQVGRLRTTPRTEKHILTFPVPCAGDRVVGTRQARATSRILRMRHATMRPSRALASSRTRCWARSK